MADESMRDIAPTLAYTSSLESIPTPGFHDLRVAPGLPGTPGVADANIPATLSLYLEKCSRRKDPASTPEVWPKPGMAG